jgi:hypothetical protein
MKDNGDYEVSHIVAKATETVDFSKVKADENGIKRTKIIVYFECFDKSNYEKKFNEQQSINEVQEQKIESLKTETAQKLATLEAKLNALLLLNSKGAVLTAEN